MKYLIIGLGIYGSNLAIDLTARGHEVIGADIKPTLVEQVKDRISTAYILDSTDEAALSMLPLKNVDVVIVAIGENFGASVRTVATLKLIGVKHIYARAIDPLHESILEGFNIDRIIKPEQRAAADLVDELELGTDVMSMTVDKTHRVMRFAAPAFLEGEKYSELDLAKGYGLTLIAVTRLAESVNAIGISRMTPRVLDVAGNPDLLVARGDSFVVYGSTESFEKLHFG